MFWKFTLVRVEFRDLFKSVKTDQKFDDRKIQVESMFEMKEGTAIIKPKVAEERHDRK
jgi:hypothetical protein